MTTQGKPERCPAICQQFSALRKRCDGLVEWLRKEAPECFTEQKHLDEGKSQERIYWHYGYMVAIRDVLRLLTGSDGKR